MADAPPSPPLLLASTSPQRKAILEQLHIPFDVVAPRYDEETLADADPFRIVHEHARGKARSVADIAEDRPVVGVDTAVVLDGRIFVQLHEALDLEPVRAEKVDPVAVTQLELDLARVLPLDLPQLELGSRELGTYAASGEWEGRAGGYAIQGRGAALVSSIEGDYLNVVGLPAALLVRLLAERFSGVYGFG